ncbi:MAG: zinc ribbon domain-containing protein [Myxococcota bacterium]|nr:zinc ribbon domain-containing protein [Myxococcota bacterium]
MAHVSEKPCRKCGVKNPVTNHYCRSCGAFLSVSTTAILAARKPILPAVKKIRLRWIGLSAFVILGLLSLIFGAVLLATWVGSDSGFRGNRLDSSAIARDFSGTVLIGIFLFLLAFGLAGIAMAWLVRGRAVVELGIASIVVLILLAVIGSALSDDVLFIAAVLLVPAAALACLGGKLGEIWFDKENRI